MRIQRFVVLALLNGSVVSGCSKPVPIDEVSVGKDQTIEELPAAKFETADWPWWRGPRRDGVAEGPAAPVKWSATENVVWKADVPGRGHASPTVVGGKVFLLTADEQKETQSVVCYDRETGKQLWLTGIHQGGLESEVHRKNTQASATAACDGERVLSAFLNGGAVWVTALDLDGKQLWQTKVGEFDSNFGYSPSPVIYKSLVIVAGDNQGGGFLAALHRKTGKVRWRKSRPAVATYATPVVARVAGGDQLLISGGDQVSSYNPDTGEPIWSCEGTTRSTVGTIAFAGDVVFASAGYPKSEIIAVRADGSKRVVWRNDRKLYVPSLLHHDGYLYAVNDNGIGYCWNANSGKEEWKARIGGDFSASPVLSGGNIYVSNERGKTFVFKATPSRYEPVSENQLGDEAFASPVICGGQIFLRVADSSSGSRREMLYCIGSRGIGL